MCKYIILKMPWQKIIIAVIIIILLFIITYPFMAVHVYPFIRFTTYYTSMTGKDMWEGYNILKVGDIVLSRDYRKLTNVVTIMQEYSHVGICVSKDQKNEILHSKPYYNVHYSTFADFCFKSDKVCILRPNIPSWQINEIIESAKQKIGSEFDIYLTNPDNDKYTCAELIYLSDINNYLDLRKYVNTKSLLFGGYITPDIFYNSDKMSKVWIKY